MKSIFWKYVGSYSKKNMEYNDIDVRTFYLTNYAKRDFHDRIYDKKTNKIIDIDYWELGLALENIINGEPNIFLYNTLFCEDYKPIDYYGKKLVENHDKLYGKNLIDSAINYIDKKLNMVKTNSLYSPLVSSHKTIYYACADVSELLWNLSGNCGIKMELSKDIVDIKNERMPLEDAIYFATEVKREVLKLNISNNPDYEWVDNYIKEVYSEYK
jgi:hypothetical protein